MHVCVGMTIGHGQTIRRLIPEENWLFIIQHLSVSPSIRAWGLAGVIIIQVNDSCRKFTGPIYLSHLKDYVTVVLWLFGLYNLSAHGSICCLNLECVPFGHEHCIYIILAPPKPQGSLKKMGLRSCKNQRQWMTPKKHIYPDTTQKLDKWTHPSCSHMYKTSKI